MDATDFLSSSSSSSLAGWAVLAKSISLEIPFDDDVDPQCILGTKTNMLNSSGAWVLVKTRGIWSILRVSKSIGWVSTSSGFLGWTCNHVNCNKKMLRWTFGTMFVEWLTCNSQPHTTGWRWRSEWHFFMSQDHLVAPMGLICSDLTLGKGHDQSTHCWHDKSRYLKLWYLFHNPVVTFRFLSERT